MTQETADWLGIVLAGGRYQVTAKLGEGGMGFVYRAHDRNLDTEVVIKVPRPVLFQDPEFAGRFAREVRSLVRLVHPHIVKVTDVGQQDGLPFAVMQYLAGGSLRDRQGCGPDGQPLPLPREKLRDWLEAVALALDFIHRQKYVHRDVKPDNILFDGEGLPYLGDFGIAKALADDRPGIRQTVLTGTGLVIGTARYMAPELILGQPYDGRVDQYALGVMVHELLSGRVPFDGPTPAAIVVQQTSQPPPRLDQLLPTVPRAVAVAVHRALERDPRHRYPDCLAFARAVLEQAGATVASTPAAQTEATTVSCPACRTAYRIPMAALGKRVRCPSCKAVGQPLAKTQVMPARRPETLAETRQGLQTQPSRPPSPSGLAPTAAALPSRRTRRVRPAAVNGSGTDRLRIWLLLGGGFLGVLVVTLVCWLLFRDSESSDDLPVERAESRPLPREDIAVQAVKERQMPREDVPVQKEQVKERPLPQRPQEREVPRTNTASLKGHGIIVTSVVCSPDGKTLASGSWDKTIKLWNVGTGKQRATLTGHTDVVYSVAYSPDGQTLASGSWDKTIKLWDVATGKERATLTGHTGWVKSVAYSPDGQTLASASADNTVRLWK